jgi:cytochrome c oxidase subunit 3
MQANPDKYYVPHGTRWPIVGSIGLFLIVSGAALMMNQSASGKFVSMLGVVALVVMLFGWLGNVIRESEGGFYNAQVDRSFRWGMSWFIFSEVMFFAVFFGTLFYARQLVVPWLAGEGNNFFTHFFLWDGFENAWPTAGPGRTEEFEVMHAWASRSR